MINYIEKCPPSLPLADYINNELIPVIVDIIGELQRQGQYLPNETSNEDLELELEEALSENADLERIIERQNDHMAKLQEENANLRAGREVTHHTFSNVVDDGR
jgi:hypothetical protein